MARNSTCVIGLRKFTVAQQFYALRHCPIAIGNGQLGPERLFWQFDVRPTPLSRSYKVELEYTTGSYPRVSIVSPDLTMLAEGRVNKIPHVYSREHPVRLCLYNPRRLAWTASQLLVATIVPWTYIWLYFFEEWLYSNEWKGGGDHPGENDEKQNQTYLEH